MCIAAGCLKPTPAEYFQVLSGIPLAELRRKAATISLARRSLEPNKLRSSAKLKIKIPYNIDNFEKKRKVLEC